MGTDLILASISMKMYPKKGLNHLHGIENQLNLRIGLMLQVQKENGIGDREKWDEVYDSIRGDEAPVKDKEIIEDASQIIEEFADCLGRRDVTYMNYPERIIILSGGTSYGDSPTDGYDIISRFSCLPQWLLDAGGFE